MKVLADTKNLEYQELAKELNRLKRINEEKCKEIQAENRKNRCQDDSSLNEIITINEYEKYKKTKLQELEEFENKCSKNNEIIASLQLELKAAKALIKNPCLKNTIYEKLHDYLEEFEDIGNKTSIPTTRNTSRVFRRRVYSTKAASNINIAETESKIGLSPQVSSKFKFYSRKPTLDISKPIYDNHPNYLSNQHLRVKSAKSRKK